jgi:hypothetical protein
VRKKAGSGSNKMKIINGKIKECTEAELFIFWLKNWSWLIDFYSYKKSCQENGTKIKIEEE